MWVHEYTAETAVSPEAIWAVLSDLGRWPRWDTSMERAARPGPFAVGTQVPMTPVGQDPIVSTIVALSAPECYADRTDLGPVTLEFSQTARGSGSGPRPCAGSARSPPCWPRWA